jgi:hypothetical protein
MRRRLMFDSRWLQVFFLIVDASRPDGGRTKAPFETGTAGSFARGIAVISLSVLLASVYWVELYFHSTCSLYVQAHVSLENDWLRPYY